MKLHYREMGTGKPLVILHGLFGFSDNWQSHAKKLSEYFRVLLVDLRNHGRSDWSDEFSYDLMVDDIHELYVDLNLQGAILLGHSMGGKVVMQFAQKYPELPHKLVVVDIGIKEYPLQHGDVLTGINAIDLGNIASRMEAEEQMRPHINSERVVQFLLKNLHWKEKGILSWRSNMVSIERHLENIHSSISSKEVGIPSVFIRGERSHYILDEDIEGIESTFIDSEVITIQDAGHWVHADQPEAFQNALLSFCLK